jgi:UDP-hydrolysing UDP-N-acetyl-D-glucosamine 2-epimerase
MPKKIAVVTATRAEFGLLSRLVHALEADTDFELQLMVTGAHLLASQGLTVTEIEQQNLPITEKIAILEEGKHAATDLADATAKALSKFAQAFKKHQPDAVVVLGDRYELLGICSAALLTHTPIIHLHGGEVTEGAMDEAIRHAVTKMASLHFVAAEPYRKRVIQMGEQPSRVFNVGAPGLDVIAHCDYLTQPALETDLQLNFTHPLFLVTYHPATWENTDTEQTLQNIFKALEKTPIATVIWTAANTDEMGGTLNEIIQAWVKTTSLNAKFVTSLGSQRYLSLMALADVVLGNSSSGIIEAPALKTPTVNIGTRQQGRLMANSIFQASQSVSSISAAIQQALEFKQQGDFESLYGQGKTVSSMLEILKQQNFDTLKTKPFYDNTRETQGENDAKLA